MNIDDDEFLQSVEHLQALARTGASLSTLLDFAKANIATRSSSTHALVAFYRAFDIPLSVATSLGTWVGFSGTNPGVSADELESKFGELIRRKIRQKVARS